MMDVQLPNTPHFRNFAAILLGLTLSVVLVGSVEAVGHSFYPPPADLDFNDPDAIAELLANAPPLALALVIVAWAAGIMGGCFLAGVIGAQQAQFCSLVTGCTFSLFAILMLIQLPHPVWFNFFSLAILFPSGYLGAKMAQALIGRWQQEIQQRAENETVEAISEVTES